MTEHLQDVTESKKAEVVSCWTEEHYRCLYDSVPVGLYRTSLQGRILDANPALLRILGYPHLAALQALDPADLYVCPEDRRQEQGLLKHKGAVRDFEVQMRRRDGTVIWVRLCVWPVRDAEDGVEYHEYCLEDITAHRQRSAELALVLEATKTVSSTLDLEEVLARVAEEMVTTANADGCTLSRWDEEEDAVVHWIHWPCGGSEIADEMAARHAREDSLLARAALESRCPVTVCVSDPDGEPAMIERMRKVGSASQLMLPLVTGERVIGLVELDRAKDKPQFSENEVRLCQALADQAAIAIENARLNDKTRRRLQEQTVLREAGSVISSALDVGTVLTRIAERMGQVVEATSAYLCSCEPETLTASVLAEWIGPQACAREKVSDLGASYPEDVELLELMLAGQHKISHVDDPALPESDRAHMQWYGAKTALRIPLRVKSRLLGYAEIWESRWRREFTPREIALCQDLAQQAAIALENARLYEQAQHEIAERKKAEEELRRLKEFNEGIVQNMNEGIIMVGVEGNLTFANPAAAALLGYAPEELIGRHWTIIVPPDQQPIVRTADERRKRGERDRYELELVRRDGTRISVLVSGRPWFQEGRFGGSLAVFTDISERVQAEEQIRQRTAQLEALRAIGLELTAQLNLEDLLSSIVSKAVALVGGTAGGLYLYQEERDVLEWVLSVSSSRVPLGSVLRRGEGLSGKVWESGEPLIVDDYEHWKGRAEVFEGYPFKAMVGVPIQWGDSFLGVVVVEGGTSDAFSPADAELLLLFAAQAAIALENARLHTETQRRLNEQTVLREAGVIISAALDLETVLALVAEQMAQAVDATSAYICNHDTEKMISTVVAEYISPQANARERVSDLGATYAESDPDFLEAMRAGNYDISDIGDPGLSEFDQSHMQQYGAKTILAIPLLFKGQLIGHTELWETRQRREFTPEEIALCQDLAQQAAIALENARLYKRARQEIAERKQAEQELEQVILELQDALAKVQTLSGLLPICANCKKIRDDQGYWHSVEVYVREHSEAEFSHGICPDCIQELYPWFSERTEVQRPGD